MAIPSIKQVIDGVFTKLDANAALKANLGDGVIYSGPVVSDKATKPYLLIRPPSGLSDVGAKNLNIWEYNLEILIVSSETESSATMETIVDQVLADLHRGTITITDNSILIECTGLNQVPSSDDLVATVLNFRILITE